MPAVCLKKCRYLSTQKRKTQVKKYTNIFDNSYYQGLLHKYRIFYFYLILTQNTKFVFYPSICTISNVF